MKLPESEREFNRAAFRAMSVAEKADYIFAYYKLPLVLILIAAIALGSVIYRAITHKDAVLYAAYCNVVPNSESDAALTEGYIAAIGSNPAKNAVECYRELYISNDDSLQNHEYAYASKLKLYAAIDGEQLDVVIMNKEAYDLLSAWGFLLDLEQACAQSAAGYGAVEAAITSNTVVVSSNRVEVELGEASELVSETYESPNAVVAANNPLFASFAADDVIYLGIIANTPRLESSLGYLRYVLEYGA